MRIPRTFLSFLRFIFPIILVAIGIVLNGYAVLKLINLGESIPSQQPRSAALPTPLEMPSPTPFVSQPSPKPTPTTTQGEPKFGHFPYPEANPEQMIVIASYARGEYQRFEKLAPEATLALMKLIYAARDDGVWIIPVSGFRSVTDQNKLFERQIQRQGSPEAAAKFSAPPGYSEHHTGYAIDFADGSFPKQDITDKFAETDAYRWLSLHAEEFGFELSFPENNAQGVSYEPWHWRFVDSPEARVLFSRTR